MPDAIVERPHWLFTSETARLNAKKGVELRRKKAEQSEPLQPKPDPKVSDASISDPLASELACVQGELVSQMRGNKDAKAVSALAMALKNVRETYHLVTGQAKPGVIRETGRTSKRSAKPTPLPSAPQDQDGNAG